MDYIIVRGDFFDAPDSLAEQVNEKIKEGYIPIGGICTWEANDWRNRYFGQAMIKTPQQRKDDQ